MAFGIHSSGPSVPPEPWKTKTMKQKVASVILAGLMTCIMTLAFSCLIAVVISGFIECWWGTLIVIGIFGVIGWAIHNE